MNARLATPSTPRLSTAWMAGIMLLALLLSVALLVATGLARQNEAPMRLAEPPAEPLQSELAPASQPQPQPGFAPR